MKKISILTSAIAIAMPFSVWAEDGSFTGLQSKVAEYYAQNYLVSDLNFAEQDGQTVIKFPAMETSSFEFGEDGAMFEKKGNIPGYTMTAIRDGDFLNHPRYKLFTDSPAAFQAEAYRRLMLTGVNAEGYSQAMYFVPDIGVFTAADIKFDSAVMSDVDAKTGLKDEVASIKAFNLKNDVKVDGNTAVYNATWTTGNINFKNPFFSISVPGVSSKATAEYEVNENTDYAKLPTDIMAVKKSASVFAAENVSNTIFTGNTIDYGIKATGKVVRDEATNMVKISGHSDVSNIKVSGLEEFSLQQINIRYQLNNIDATQIKELQAVSEKIIEAQGGEASEGNKEELTPEEKEMVKTIAGLLDKISQTAEFKTQFDLKFSEGDVVFMMALKMDGKFIVGNGDVKIYNMDKIMPDYKAQCETERAANPDAIPAACMKAGMAGMFDQYIDKSKRTIDEQGRTVDTVTIVINQTGSYVNGQKVGDPIEFDFESLFNGDLSSILNKKESVGEPLAAPKKDIDMSFVDEEKMLDEDGNIEEENPEAENNSEAEDNSKAEDNPKPEE